MERCNYEDDVSAKKIEAQPRARLYEENEDESWPQCSEEKTCKRQEGPVCVNEGERSHAEKKQGVQLCLQAGKACGLARYDARFRKEPVWRHTGRFFRQ